MELSLVSVIVPIYKVESYLCQCVDSIINQTYKNLEIILVDDGSPDNCPKICDEYALQDNRVKVIHKENGGLSDARNAGMKIASGKYLSFVDSDDVIHEKMIEVLMQPLIDDKSLKMSACQFKKFYKDDELHNITTVINKYSVVDYKRFFSICWCISCAKIFKKELFDSIKFPVGRLHEDDFTTYKLVCNSKHSAYNDSQLYFYRQREGSITSRRSLKSFMDAHDAMKEQIEFYTEKDEWELYSSVLVRLARNFALFTQTEYEKNNILLQWKNELRTLSTKPLSFKQKISYITYVWIPKMRLFVQNIIQ